MNVVVEPATRVIDDGLTANVIGMGVGFEKPFSECEPLPQFVIPGMRNVSARAVGSIHCFVLAGTAAAGLVASRATTRSL